MSDQLPKRGDSRKHTTSGVVLYVHEVGEHEGESFVVFSAVRPMPSGRCAGILQTVSLTKWLEKTEPCEAD